MWFILFCGAGQSLASEACSCDAPEAAVRRTERAGLDPGTCASPHSFFPLSQEIFQPQALPLACSFPPRALQQSLMTAPRQVCRRQWVFPLSPGAGEGAPSSQDCERISSFSLVLMSAAWYMEHNHLGWSVTPAARNSFMVEEVSATDFLHDLRQEVTSH